MKLEFFQMKTTLRMVWSGLIWITVSQAATVSPQVLNQLINDELFNIENCLDLSLDET